VAERLQLPDGGGIVVALVDRRMRGTVSLPEAGIVDAGLFGGLLLGF
jgi:hypothetical protein